VQVPAVHATHLTPPHPREERDHRRQRLLPRQTRAHRKGLLCTNSDTRAERRTSAVAPEPEPHGGRDGDQSFRCGVHEQVADHAQHHGDSGRRQSLRTQVASEGSQVKAGDLS
jgi:hypothetical protein